MADRSPAEDLRRLLRTALAARLEPDGWRELDEVATSRPLLTVVGKPLGPDFMATAQIFQSRQWPDRPPVVVDHVLGGVSYEPLRRLYPLLGDYEFAVLVGGYTFERHEDQDEDKCEDQDDEDDEEEDEASELGDHYEVRTEADVPAVAEELAKLVVRRAEPFSEQLANVDALLSRIGDPVMEHLDLRRAAVLAAVGRYEEAEHALDRWKPGPDSMTRPAERRTAHQLRRWIESRGDPTLIPAEPPPDPRQLVDRPPFGELWRQSSARQEAIKHVRAHSLGKDRVELRSMLEAELARRGLSESRIRIEAALDHLQDSRADQIRTTVNALSRIGRGITKMLREKQLPDLTLPAWLDPPDRAAYELPASERWVEIQLTNEAQAWLDEVHREIPSVFGISSIRAWLSPRPEPRQDNSAVTVHLGTQTVGTISQDHLPDFAAVIDAAAFRDELPVVQAHLAHRSTEPRYVLEISTPKHDTR